MSRSQNEVSQEARILAVLESRGSLWTPAPELARISLQYAARIFTLRRRGFRIENKIELSRGSVKHGFYRLHQAPLITRNDTPQPQPTSASLLFHPEERHRDDG